MDLNPWEFKEFEKFESANFLKQNNIDLVIFSANWLKSNKKNNPYDLMNYFLLRLFPICNDFEKNKENLEFEKYKFLRFICSNRVGREGDIVYGGSSCHLSVNPIKLFGFLDTEEVGAVYSDF